jgi:hypothetical protein
MYCAYTDVFRSLLPESESHLPFKSESLDSRSPETVRLDDLMTFGEEYYSNSRLILIGMVVLSDSV